MILHVSGKFLREGRLGAMFYQAPCRPTKRELRMTRGFEASGPEESVFRLLIRSIDALPSEAPSIDVAGQRWRLSNQGAVPAPADASEYICVSYSWGSARMLNPFDPQRPAAARARPVLETAIAALRPPAIWWDAACMPPLEPARSLCLRNMGAIYAAAKAVIVVLSPTVSELLDKVRRKETIGQEELKQLEEDDWANRAWTYQEIVNGKVTSFVAEGQSGDPVHAYTLLNAVGYAITQHRKSEQVDAYEFRQRHPHLDALETLIDDWLRADYAERSAYSIMNAMAGRTVVYPDDYFYAMVGAITSIPTSNLSDTELGPPEYFTHVCEQKGDFSFIYSNAPRVSCDAVWHPRPGRLPPIVPWPSAGERQGGELRLPSLRLYNMAKAELGQLDETARTFVRDWLHKTVRAPLPTDMGAAVQATLYRAGFTGCGEYIETMSGFFFPQNPAGYVGNRTVLVATEIIFNFGAPGILLAPTDLGTSRFCDVGVFVGPVPRSVEDVLIL
jgi:Heterokaryon incompatibility protein (HET)